MDLNNIFYDSSAKFWEHKHTRIFHDLLRGFSLDLTSNVLYVISSPLLVGLDELIEVSLGPDGETLSKEETQELLEPSPETWRVRCVWAQR